MGDIVDTVKTESRCYGARAFYEHFTFETSPSDPYQLLLIMKDLMQIIDR
jgi:hypothetical protein